MMTPNQATQRTKKVDRKPVENDSGSESSRATPEPQRGTSEEAQEVKSFIEALERSIRRASCRLALRKIMAAGVDVAVKENRVGYHIQLSTINSDMRNLLG